MKQCAFCGNTSPDEARFCANCGNSFPASAEPEAAPQEAYAPQQPEPAPQQESIPQPEPAPQQEFIPQQPEYVSQQPEYIPQPEQQPKKRKVLPWILGGVALLVIAGILVWFFCLRSTPTDRVMDAYNKTAAALEQQVGDLRNLRELGETLIALQSEKNLYSSVDFMLGDGEESLSLSLSLNRSGDVAMGDLTFNSNLSAPNEMYLWAQYSTDGETFRLAFPGLYSKTFEVDPEEMMSELPDLLDGMGMDEVFDAWDEMQSALESVELPDMQLDADLSADDEYVEAGERTLTIGGESRKCALYRPGCDISAESGGMLSDLLLFVDDRGYLVAMELEAEMGTFLCQLDGEKNPCESIALSLDSEEVLRVELEKTSDGCVLDFGAFTVTLDDEFGMATIDVDLVSMLLTYSSEKDGAYFTLSVQEDEIYMDIYASCAATDTRAEMLDGETVDLLSLGEEDLMNILLEVSENAAVDPDYAWLLELLGTQSDLRGSWYWQADMTEVLELSIASELGVEFELDEPFYLDIYLDFYTDGTYELYADETALLTNIATLRTSMVNPLVACLYDELTADGTDREAIDAAFKEIHQMTIEEYVTELLAETDFDFTADDFYANGTYSVDGDSVWIDDEETFMYFEEDGTEFLMSYAMLDGFGDTYMLFTRAD